MFCRSMRGYYVRRFTPELDTLPKHEMIVTDTLSAQVFRVLSKLTSKLYVNVSITVYHVFLCLKRSPRPLERHQARFQFQR